MGQNMSRKFGENPKRSKEMKKLLIALLLVVLTFGTFAACSGNNDDKNEAKYKVAMITDYGDITDQSFNQTTHEACVKFCADNKIDYKYYKPAGDSTAERVASVNLAINKGYNVIVMPGYAFAETIDQVASKNPTVKFIALDVAKGDLLAAHYGAEYNYDPDDEKWAGYKLPSNVTTFVYQEELAGFMAGYAAVKEGYEKLGFLGGMAVPAVIRFGYGFVQGADKAAVEMSKTDKVSINYVYGGKFNGTPEITAVMDTWYKELGTQVVFACGGGIYSSACTAATAEGVNGKVIGVDTDQHGVITKDYKKDDLCITSAMKGLAATVHTALTDLIGGDGANWDSKYASKITTLGLVSGTDVESNYVQLPIATAAWKMTNFTVDDYKALVQKMFKGEITVSNATGEMPATTISVTKHADIMK